MKYLSFQQGNDPVTHLQMVLVNTTPMCTAFRTMQTFWCFKLLTTVITRFDLVLDLGLYKLYAKRYDAIKKSI